MTAAHALAHALELPAAIGALTASLEKAGHAAWWVGESLHDALRGCAPRQWSLSTAASAQQIAAALPRAVPTRARGLAFVVPTAAGPVDLAPLRRGPKIEDDLLHRGFSVLALAWRPADRHLHDPHGGGEDIDHGRLRAVGTPAECLEIRPLRVLQAARLVALHGYRLDAALEAELPRAWQGGADPIRAIDLRRELHGLLMSPKPGGGLAVLRQSGVAAWLDFGPGEDCGRLLDGAPPDLALRLAICLRGQPGGDRCLQKIRADAELAARVRRLIGHHPIEAAAVSRRRLSVRRLLGRLDDRERQMLFALREAEIEGQEGAAATREALVLLRLALAREADERVASLALDGAAVMRTLGLGEGPRVGQALAFLRGQVDDDPDCNEPGRLLDLLTQWAEQNPAQDNSAAPD